MPNSARAARPERPPSRTICFRSTSPAIATRGAPSRPVLVVGSGQSGCQIAEDLHEAGRDVFRACGRAPWVPRRIGDRDVIWWAVEIGFFEAPLSSLPHPALRLAGNAQTTGSRGGHGLKNTEIAEALLVSLKTVETHLWSAYRKLDIASRAELPQALGAPRR